VVGDKDKIFPVHRMKTYCESRGMVLLTLNLETISKLGLSLTLWTVYPTETVLRAQWIWSWVVLRTFSGRDKSLALPGIKPHIVRPLP